MSKKILLADDSVTIQKVVSITLAHEDIDLTIVDNGAEAFAKAQQIQPDIILLDVVMPDKDGYQVCEKIKQMPELSHIPIILLTGTFEPFDEEKAEQVGANDYLKKPFESHALINKIKEMSFKGAGTPAASPVRPEHGAPGAAGDSSGFIMGGEMEIGSDAAIPPQPKVEKSGFETPRESAPEMQTPKEAPVQRGQSEDIWSVEEFEDIAGPAQKSEDFTPVQEESDPWGDVTIETDSVPEGFDIGSDYAEATPQSRDAGEPSRTGESARMDSSGFELGEEISEDELSQFLDEEGLDIDGGDEATPEFVAAPLSEGEVGADTSFDEIELVEGERSVISDDFNMADFEEPSLDTAMSEERDGVFQLSDDDMEIPLEDVEDISLGDGMDISANFDDDFSSEAEIQVSGDFDDVSVEDTGSDDDSLSLDDVEIPPEFMEDISEEEPDLDRRETPESAFEMDVTEPFEPETRTIFDEVEMPETSGNDDMFIPDDSTDTDFLWENNSQGDASNQFTDDIDVDTAEIDTSFSERSEEFESQHRFESTRMPERLQDDSEFDIQEETANVDEQIITRAMEEVSSRVAGSMPGGLGGAEPGTEEYDQAVNKIAREIIEKVAWEVVPELAEVLIKEEIKRLKGEKG
ncbi:MAG: response regulator [Deltaproteobacteria bacterium]|nr:response regulator [Candidatus Zymogenaceae bacterium]